MTAPIPLTIAKKIRNELQRCLLTIPYYLTEEDPSFVGWMDELEKGIAADRVETLQAMATLAHMTGDMEYAERFLTRAETAGASQHDLIDQRIAMSQNLGYASKALSLCEQVFSRPPIQFSFGLRTLLGVGAFHLLSRVIRMAGPDHPAVRATVHFDEIKHMADGAAAQQFKDEQYASVLDLAGAMLRRRRLFWLDESPRFFFDDEMQCAGVRFRVAVSPEEAAKMDAELVRAIIDQDLIDVPITVGFIGVLNDDGSVEGGHVH